MIWLRNLSFNIGRNIRGIPCRWLRTQPSQHLARRHLRMRPRTPKSPSLRRCRRAALRRRPVCTHSRPFRNSAGSPDRSSPAPIPISVSEVWMPSSGWNGKILAIGQRRGLAGNIVYGNMSILGGGKWRRRCGRGYAAASTDTGHAADMTDDAWAPGHPEKVIDFGYRGIHELAVKAKDIVERFYGHSARHVAIFQGCSNGGRAALMEAQRYPGDFDGLIAGAPANNTHTARRHHRIRPSRQPRHRGPQSRPRFFQAQRRKDRRISRRRRSDDPARFQHLLL